MIVGCIGLGRMGGPMARRIAAAGHEVLLLDRVAEAVAALSELGGRTEPTPAAIARGADLVLTSLPGPPEVEAVFTGPDGVLEGARKGCVLVETSTIGPAQSRRLAALAAARGLEYLDAPVSGGVDGARDGTLTAMVGGEARSFDRARPVLEAISTKARHVGPSGAGSAAKLINQMVFLTHAAVLCEMVAYGERAGLDPAALLDVLETSMAGQPLMSGWHHRIPRDETEGGFAIRRVLKDLRLGRDAGSDAGAATPVFDAALDAYEDAAARGFEDADLTVLRRLYKSRP